MRTSDNRWIWIITFVSVWILAILIPWHLLPALECPIKSTLGIPCPTCGGVRAITALKSFHLLQAFAINPLVTVGLLGCAIWGILLLLIPAFPTPDHLKTPIRRVLIGGMVFMVMLHIVVPL
jgi:hypothetical protein